PHATPRGRHPVVAHDRHAGRRRERRRLSVTPGRRAALDVLRAVRRGVLADRALADAVARLEPRERAWTQELVYGTLRLRGRIDHMLAPLVRRGLGALGPHGRDTLRRARDRPPQ